MKIICEYCGCSVEVDENMKCPQCGAPLGDAIKAEEERLKKEAEEKEAVEKAEAEKKEAEAAKAEKQKTIISAIASIGAIIFGTRNKHRPVPPRPNVEYRTVEPRRTTERRMPEPSRHNRHTENQGPHSRNFGYRGAPGGRRHK